MKKLRRQLHDKHEALRKAQHSRHRLRKIQHKLKDLGFGALAKRLDARADKITEHCKELHQDIRQLEKRIEEREQASQEGRSAFIKLLESWVGAGEGSAVHAHIVASGPGGSSSWPWCSKTVATALVDAGGWDWYNMPSNPWYSGAWLTWGDGHRVSYADRQPGDLLIFDWGDGGITDHVATYVGNGIKIGGNENNRVEKDAVPVSNIVGVVRPDW